MKKLLLLCILVFTKNSMTNKKVTPAWYPQWDRVTQDDIKEYTEKFTNSLQKDVNEINALLLQHATAPVPKVSAFKRKLNDILEKSRGALKDLAKQFTKEIQSEAHNTYDYKIQKRINFSGAPKAAATTKIIRKNRRTLVGYHNQ